MRYEIDNKVLWMNFHNCLELQIQSLETYFFIHSLTLCSFVGRNLANVGLIYEKG